MTQWWRNTPEDAIDWTFNFGVLQHYFPTIEVGKMTLDNYGEKIKIVKKLLGQDDKDDKDKVHSPDDWFLLAMEGKIQPDGNVAMSEDESIRAKQESQLRSLGFMK